jgi:hypothetical protein
MKPPTLNSDFVPGEFVRSNEGGVKA